MSEDHLSQRVLPMQGRESGPEAEKQLFPGKRRWLEQRRMDRAIHWFLHKFNVDLSLIKLLSFSIRQM